MTNSNQISGEMFGSVNLQATSTNWYYNGGVKETSFEQFMLLQMMLIATKVLEDSIPLVSLRDDNGIGRWSNNSGVMR